MPEIRDPQSIGVPAFEAYDPTTVLNEVAEKQAKVMEIVQAKKEKEHAKFAKLLTQKVDAKFTTDALKTINPMKDQLHKEVVDVYVKKGSLTDLEYYEYEERWREIQDLATMSNEQKKDFTTMANAYVLHPDKYLPETKDNIAISEDPELYIKNNPDTPLGKQVKADWEASGKNPIQFRSDYMGTKYGLIPVEEKKAELSLVKDYRLNLAPIITPDEINTTLESGDLTMKRAIKGTNEQKNEAAIRGYYRAGTKELEDATLKQWRKEKGDMTAIPTGTELEDYYYNLMKRYKTGTSVTTSVTTDEPKAGEKEEIIDIPTSVGQTKIIYWTGDPYKIKTDNDWNFSDKPLRITVASPKQFNPKTGGYTTIAAGDNVILFKGVSKGTNPITGTKETWAWGIMKDPNDETGKATMEVYVPFKETVKEKILKYRNLLEWGKSETVNKTTPTKTKIDLNKYGGIKRQ